MYGLRDRPPLAANVHVTVADALAGSASPDAVAGVVVDAGAAEVAVPGAVAVLEAAGAAAVVELVAGEVQPTTPTMAAADSPQAKALRVTAE
jgi:hypothetical protein